MLSYIEIWGTCFMSESSAVSIMVRWIAEMLFMLFFAYIAEQRTEHSCVQSILAFGLFTN